MMNEIYPNYIAWRLSYQCNYRCKACFFSEDALKSVHSGLDPQELLNFLDRTEKKWRIGISGGEAFFIKDFLELAEKITRIHQLEINTNLSLTGKINEFSERINPKSVPKLIATYHPLDDGDRNRRSTFIQNYMNLTKKGFTTEAVFVVTPERIDLFYELSDEFKTYDISLTPKPFRGIWKGKEYPYAFDHEARKVFATVPNSTRRIPLNYQGVLCRAGSSCLRIHNNGTITRCGELPYEDYIVNKQVHLGDTMPTAENTVLGFVSGSPKEILYSEARPCKSSMCTCFGRHFTVLSSDQKNFVKGMRNFMKNEYLEAKNFFLKTIEENPTHASAHNNLGVVYHYLGQSILAKECFQKALTLNSRSELFKQNQNSEQPQLTPDVLQ